MTRKVARDSDDGRFITKAAAKLNPGNSSIETVDDNHVTPAMADAGAAELTEWLEIAGMFDGPNSDICRKIYAAMRAAR